MLNLGAMAVDPVLAVLRSHGTRALWHYTLAERVPGIVRAGAIYSRRELGRLGIACDSDHYYGDPEKQRILSGYVSCATMPPWGMMGDETEELAILEIDPAVVTTPATCFCPGWSPEARFPADEIVTWTDPEHAESLYSGPGYQTVRGAEIFVLDKIELGHVRGIVYYDRPGVERALPVLRAALREGADHQAGDGHTIGVRHEPTRFPRNWQSEGPPWMRDDNDGDDEPIF